MKRLSQMAQSSDLLVSAGSDFHRSFEYGPTLGVDADRLAAGQYVWNQRALNGSVGSTDRVMSNGIAGSSKTVESTAGQMRPDRVDRGRYESIFQYSPRNAAESPD